MVILNNSRLKKSIIILIYSLLLIASAKGQSEAPLSKIAIHFSNPITLFMKAGLKLEYRNKQMGYLLMGKIYYAGLPRYPGEKGEIAIRHYFKKDEKKHENFLYGKLVAGHLQNFSGSGSGFTSIQAVAESNYYGLGAGWGKHYNFKHFFIEFNAGLKYVVPDVTQDPPFFLTGPGSILDLNFNMGIQF